MTKGLLLISSFLMFIMSGCITGSESGFYGEGNTTTISVAGSTTVSPLMRQLRLAYEEQNKGVRVEVQDIGTSAGIVATLEGVSHIAMSSRRFSEQELSQGLVAKPFALDGIAIIVNKNNNVDNLTSEQVTKIFRGDIVNWSQVGGEDANIIVVSREEGSGIRSSFEELANLESDIYVNGRIFRDSDISRNAIYEKGTGAVKGTVRSSKNAIGYISTGVLDDTVKAVKIDGVGFSEETIRNGSYTLSNEFFIATREHVPRSVESFIDFIFSDEGQALIKEKGFVSIS